MRFHVCRRRGLVRSADGVTLVEMMIVVAIVGILAVSCVPGLDRLLSRHRAVTAATDLVHDFALARSEALRRGRRVYVAPLATRWQEGWAVFVDRNDDRRFDPPAGAGGDELIARHGALGSSTTVTNATNASREPFTDLGAPQRTYLLFDGAGYPRQRNGALNIGSLVITDRTGPAVTVRTICVAAYGRIRVVDRAGC